MKLTWLIKNNLHKVVYCVGMNLHVVNKIRREAHMFSYLNNKIREYQINVFHLCIRLNFHLAILDKLLDATRS